MAKRQKIEAFDQHLASLREKGWRLYVDGNLIDPPTLQAWLDAMPRPGQCKVEWKSERL